MNAPNHPSSRSSRIRDRYRDYNNYTKLPIELDNLLQRHGTGYQQIVNMGLLPLNQNYNNRSKNLLPSLTQFQRSPKSNILANNEHRQSVPHNSDLEPDLELDNSNHKGVEDFNQDRQVAESNKDPGESIVVKSEDDIESFHSRDDENHRTSDGDEIVNRELPIEEVNQDIVGNQDDVQSSRSTDPNSEESSVDDDQSSSANNTEEPDRIDTKDDDESLKETGDAIDEEVDRMTQPNSGATSQQDHPFDYKSTVNFDDTLNTLKPVAPGDLIAHFVAPQRESDGKELQKKESGKQRLATDLQIEHSILKLNNSGTTGAIKNPISKNEKHNNSIQANFMDQDRTLDHARNYTGTFKKHNEQKSETKVDRIRSRRKRSTTVEIERKKNKIKAPYEFNKFSNTLPDFDSLIGQSSLNVAELDQPQVLSANSSDSSIISNKIIKPNSAEVLVDDIGTVYPEQTEVDDSLQTDLILQNKSTTPLISDRRFDDESSKENETKQKLIAQNLSSEHWPSGRADDSPAASRYHYLTSNDSSIQELLSQEQLLNALKYSQLPQPIVSSNNWNNNSSIPSASHLNAGSPLSADHGLLIYPSAGEKLSHKSMSKKKKDEKIKNKRKMTIGLKKGGHKNKKHKKEEKKYLKEKKFKGVKKGKKVSKGKGGQGGKKGKKRFKDKGFKKKGFKNVWHKEEFGQKKSYFDEFRDKDFKKKWKKFDDKYNYAQMKKWQAKDLKNAKKMKDHGEKFKKYDKARWKKKYQKHSRDHSASSKKNKKYNGF